MKYPIPVTHNEFVANFKIAVRGSSMNVSSISGNDLLREEILIKWKILEFPIIITVDVEKQYFLCILSDISHKSCCL